VVLGSGHRLFRDGAVPVTMRPVELQTLLSHDLVDRFRLMTSS